MKSRVLLVAPPYVTRIFSSFPPMGLANIAAYITDADPQIKVKVIDFAVEKFSAKQWRKELQDFKPEVVGIGVLTLNFPHGTFIAKLTKEFDRSVLVVMGGIHATMRSEECLNYCDVVVRGEGELTFYELIQDRELSTIKGISYIRDSRIVHNAPRERIQNLGDLPIPAHHLFKMEKYEAYPVWGVMGSRGCPFDCIFCDSPQMWGRIARYRSAKKIVDEIEYLHDVFKIKGVFFFDDALNISKRRLIEICDEIIKRNLHEKMEFACQMRANSQLVSPDLFKKMREANFRRVEFGFESGSEKVLKSIRKDLTIKEIKEAVRMAGEAGIRVKGFFMVGNWGENIWDILKTWRLVLSIDVEPSFAICTPFPGTDFYRMAKEKGYLDNINWRDYNQFIPVARTDKMSRSMILIVFIFSAFLELLLLLMRGKPKRTISQVMTMASLVLRGGLNILIGSRVRRCWDENA